MKIKFLLLLLDFHDFFWGENDEGILNYLLCVCVKASWKQCSLCFEQEKIIIFVLHVLESKTRIRL